MRVCKHGCDVKKMFCFSRANLKSTNLKEKVFELKNRQVYFILIPIPLLAETWTIFTNMLYCHFFLNYILSKKNSYFGKNLFLQNKN